MPASEPLQPGQQTLSFIAAQPLAEPSPTPTKEEAPKEDTDQAIAKDASPKNQAEPAKKCEKRAA
eukprot:12836676-Alexandrium_andersonii.AAC.1